MWYSPLPYVHLLAPFSAEKCLFPRSAGKIRAKLLCTAVGKPPEQFVFRFLLCRIQFMPTPMFHVKQNGGCCLHPPFAMYVFYVGTPSKCRYVSRETLTAFLLRAKRARISLLKDYRPLLLFQSFLCISSEIYQRPSLLSRSSRLYRL